MRSIQRNFAFLAFVSVALFSIVVGLVCVLTLVSKSDADAATAMNLACAKEAMGINELLEGIEDAVDVERSYVEEKLLKSDWKSHQDELLDDVAGLFSTIATHANGSVVYYLRLNGDTDASRSSLAELAEDGRGFLYLRDSRLESFREVPLSERTQGLPGENYGNEVGWDLTALERGEPLWPEPYFVSGPTCS